MTNATTFQPGDIAFTGYNSDDPDEFSFVLLVDVKAGDEIRFTDAGWLKDGGFRSGEGELVWTADVDIPAGTTVTVADNVANVGVTAGGIHLSFRGDQIIAFEGAFDDPTPIAAIHMRGDFEDDATTQFKSALPAGLVEGETAVAIAPEVDNAVYTGDLRKGTKEELLAAINDQSNWTRDFHRIDDVSPQGFMLVEPQPGELSLVQDGLAQAEGDAGQTSFVFTVNRENGSDGAVTVDFAVSGGDADAEDFIGGVLPSGTISFADGETTQTIIINVAGDTDFEADEAFTLSLSNPTGGATIGDGTATATIVNDDVGEATLSIAPDAAVAAEGDAGTTDFTFIVTRSGDVSTAVSVDFAVASAAADADDFGGVLPTGTVNFAINETQQTITVQVSGDEAVETDEGFTLTLSNATANGVIAQAAADGVILNDDVTPIDAAQRFTVEEVTNFTADSGAEIAAFIPALIDDPTGRVDAVVFTSGDGIQGAAFLDGVLNVPLLGEEVVSPELAGATGSDVTSVAYGETEGGKRFLAVAAPGADEQAPGLVIVADLNTLDPDTGAVDLALFEVGALPDMLTFSPDGKTLLVANEGEPGGGVDPKGSVSLIAIDAATDAGAGLDTAANATFVQTADFTAFDAQQADLESAGLRIFPGQTLSDDLEPEFIAVAPDGQTAFVSLQEANAVGVLDIPTAAFTEIRPLPLKDHSRLENALDASDEDGAINIQPWPVFGLLMPDSITAFEVGGQTFYATANEGDARDEDARIKDLTLDPTAFPDAATLQLDENLGRLEASTIDGDTDGDGDFDQLFVYGGRSFTIFDDAGNLVFDSGSQIERIIADLEPALFNSQGDAGSFDERSDNKGPEPEAIEFGEVDGVPLLFIGLERTGGVLVYDITDPFAPVFDQYVRTDGDIAPEGFDFVSAEDSPTGEALLFVASEGSATVTGYEISLPAFDLQVTEIWPGQEGADVTADWFEITNVGDAPWDPAVDGTLFYDDESADPSVADAVNGLTGLAPGESAIVVIGDATDAETFETVWGVDVDLSGVEVGWADGSGLGGGGDAVNVWLGDPTVDGELIETEAYPDTTGSSGVSYDVVRGEFSSEATGAVPTTATGGTAGDEPALATPGFQASDPVATFDLQISEIWPGQEGADVTADWFEITNVGDAAWTSATDGTLFYDDESADPTVADAVIGLTTLAPGESAIVVIGDATDAETFASVWGSVVDLSGVEVGWADGAGLGQGGDAVNVWLGDPLAGGALLDTAAFPDTTGASGRSFDVDLGAFSTLGNAAGAVATSALGGTDGDEPAIASPGNVAALSDSVGGAGDDVIIGTPGVDTLEGNGGDDMIFGRESDDFLNGGPGADMLDGEGGTGDVADYRTSIGGVDVDLGRAVQQQGDAQGDTLINIEGVFGSQQADIILSTDGIDANIAGFGGNDLLSGADGADFISGGEGDDEIDGGAGDDFLNGGDGADQIDGGADVDTVTYTASGAAVDVRLWRLGAQEGGEAEGDELSNIERVLGSAFNDGLAGANGQSNDLLGLDGDDFLFGANQSDILIGGNGQDQLFGRNGADSLTGGEDDDFLDGGAGADDIDGGEGFDTVSYANSNAGVDVDLSRGDGPQIGGQAQGDSLTTIEAVNGSAFTDRLTGVNGLAVTFHANGGNDIVTGADLVDTLKGGEGMDVIAGLAGADDLDGGAGVDTLDYTASAAGVDVRLFRTEQQGGDAQGDMTSGFERVFGSQFADGLAAQQTEGAQLFGFGGTDFLFGGNQIDLLDGGADADQLFGRNRADVLLGGAGDDLLDGGAGADLIDGGEDTDTVDYASSRAGVDVRLFRTEQIGGEAHGDLLFNVERVIGSQFADGLAAKQDEGAELFGLDGDDFLFGGNRVDLLVGGAGDDMLDARNQADTLIGGEGEDVLTGGLGTDLFVFDDGDGADVITDFKVGVDTIGFNAGLGLAFADLNIVQIAGGVVVSGYGAATDLVLLQGALAADLDASSFDFGIV